MKDGTPLFLRLQAHEVLDVEEASVVGAVIGTASLAGALGRFGKRAKYNPRLIGYPDAFIGTCALSKRAAHPQRAFIQVRQEFGADVAAERKIDGDDQSPIRRSRRLSSGDESLR